MGVSTAITVVAAVLATAAIAWCAALAGRLRQLTAVRSELARMAAEGDLARFGAAVDARLQSLEEVADRLHMDDSAIAERLSRAVRNVGLVRFDALPGLAGMFSFSLALLDDRRDGVIITSIYGRSDSRMYVKPVADGASDIPLTAEETGAIAQAFGEAAPPSAERRTRRG